EQQVITRRPGSAAEREPDEQEREALGEPEREEAHVEGPRERGRAADRGERSALGTQRVDERRAARHPQEDAERQDDAEGVLPGKDALDDREGDMEADARDRPGGDEEVGVSP